MVGVVGAFVPGALVSFREAGISALSGYVLFFLVARGYARLRGLEGLGQGDWKLAAMMGAFLGVQRLLLTVFLGSLAGLVWGLVQATRLRSSAPLPGLEGENAAVPEFPPPDEPVSIGKFRLPFGTFLAASAIFVLFLGDFILAWYGSFFR